MRSQTIDAYSGPRTKRKSLVVRTLEALHTSRRREARRLLRRYRHLIEEPCGIGMAPDSPAAEESSRDANGNKASVCAGHRIRRSAEDQIVHDEFA